LVVNGGAGGGMRSSHNAVPSHRRSNRPVFSKRWMR
jgi:hypothetical protein